MIQPIRHSALFCLKHTAGSAQEASFLDAPATLSGIPGVQDFAISAETSPKNAYDFSVSMVFKDQAAYDGYDSHPFHRAFVAQRWVPEVSAIMEHDTVLLRRKS